VTYVIKQQHAVLIVSQFAFSNYKTFYSGFIHVGLRVWFPMVSLEFFI